MRILVDMDSILCDFYFGVLERYTADTGLPVAKDALNHWDAVLPNGKDSWAYFKEPGFFRELKPIPGALEFVRSAKERGHDVLIVTASTLTHGPGEKFEWLTQHLPDFDRNQVIFAKRKELVSGDLLIDDNAPNCAGFLRAQPNSRAIGIEYPYNTPHPEAFTHLVPSYLDFAGAWQKISSMVF